MQVHNNKAATAFVAMFEGEKASYRNINAAKSNFIKLFEGVESHHAIKAMMQSPERVDAFFDKLFVGIKETSKQADKKIGKLETVRTTMKLQARSNQAGVNRRAIDSINKEIKSLEGERDQYIKTKNESSSKSKGVEENLSLVKGMLNISDADIISKGEKLMDSELNTLNITHDDKIAKIKNDISYYKNAISSAKKYGDSAVDAVIKGDIKALGEITDEQHVMSRFGSNTNFDYSSSGHKELNTKGKDYIETMNNSLGAAAQIKSLEERLKVAQETKTTTINQVTEKFSSYTDEDVKKYYMTITKNTINHYEAEVAKLNNEYNKSAAGEKSIDEQIQTKNTQRDTIEKKTNWTLQDAQLLDLIKHKTF